MKKITLIACAALVASLLVSCSSEAGVKDYNDVTTTSTYNSYVVKGTIATTTENVSKTFNAKDKQINGSSSSITDTKRIVSTPAYVTFGTDENFDGNYTEYKIAFDSSTGFKSSVKNSETYWDGMIGDPDGKEKETAAADIKDYNKNHEEAKEANEPIDGEEFKLVVIDDVIYAITKNNGERFVVTSDAEKIAEGESFSLSVTIVTTDTTNNSTSFDSDGDQSQRTVTNNKVSTTYDLTFTAK